MRPIEIEAILEVSKHLVDVSEALNKLAAVGMHHMKQEKGAETIRTPGAATGQRPALYVVR